MTDEREYRASSVETSGSWRTSWVVLALLLTLMRQAVGLTNLVQFGGANVRALLVVVAVVVVAATTWWLLNATPTRGRGAVEALGRTMLAILAYLAVLIAWVLLTDLLSAQTVAVVGGVSFAGLVGAGAILGLMALVGNKRFTSVEWVALGASLAVMACGIAAIVSAAHEGEKAVGAVVSVLGLWSLTGLGASLALSRPRRRRDWARWC